MQRLFVYDGREFPDWDPQLTPHQVRAIIADFYPDIATTDIVHAHRGPQSIYLFAKNDRFHNPPLHPTPDDDMPVPKRDPIMDRIRTVISTFNGRSTIAVHRIGADPELQCIESDDHTIVAQALPSVIQRAFTRWAKTPMYSTHHSELNQPTQGRRRRKPHTTDHTTLVQTPLPIFQQPY